MDRDRRLDLAAKMMAGLLANPSVVASVYRDELWPEKAEAIAAMAIGAAWALVVTDNELRDEEWQAPSPQPSLKPRRIAREGAMATKEFEDNMVYPDNVPALEIIGTKQQRAIWRQHGVGPRHEMIMGRPHYRGDALNEFNEFLERERRKAKAIKDAEDRKRGSLDPNSDP